MCSSPHWQVGQSWFREKLFPANREQRLSRWADFAKNCLPQIGSKVLPWFREKYRALWRQKMGSNMRPRYIQFRNISNSAIYRAYTVCVSKLPIIGSDNGLLLVQCQAIIWTNAGILLNGPLGTTFSEILIKIHTFSFKKMHFKILAAQWRPFCFGLNVLII